MIDRAIDHLIQLVTNKKKGYSDLEQELIIAYLFMTMGYQVNVWLEYLPVDPAHNGDTKPLNYFSKTIIEPKGPDDDMLTHTIWFEVLWDGIKSRHKKKESVAAITTFVKTEMEQRRPPRLITVTAKWKIIPRLQDNTVPIDDCALPEEQIGIHFECGGIVTIDRRDCKPRHELKCAGCDKFFMVPTTVDTYEKLRDYCKFYWTQHAYISA